MSDAASNPAEVPNNQSDVEEAGESLHPAPPVRTSNDSEPVALSRPSAPSLSGAASDGASATIPVDWRALFSVDDIKMLLVLDDEVAKDLVTRPKGEIGVRLQQYYGESASLPFIKTTSELFVKNQDIRLMEERAAEVD